MASRLDPALPAQGQREQRRRPRPPKGLRPQWLRARPDIGHAPRRTRRNNGRKSSGIADPLAEARGSGPDRIVRSCGQTDEFCPNEQCPPTERKSVAQEKRVPVRIYLGG